MRLLGLRTLFNFFLVPLLANIDASLKHDGGGTKAQHYSDAPPPGLTVGPQ